MPRPNFSGAWELARDSSALEIPVPDLAIFTIDHQEPRFHLERTLGFGERRDTFAIDLVIGSDQPAFLRGDATVYPNARWDGDELVFDARIVRGAEEAVNVVRYRLESGGRVLVAEERFRGAVHYDNRWVLTRTSALNS